MLPVIATQPPSVSLLGAPLGLAAASSATVAGSAFGLSPAASTQSVSAAGAVDSLQSLGNLPGAAVSSATSPAPFADLLTEAVGQVEQYESQAKTAIEGMMSGQGVDVHQAMIATEKAESGFELVLAVRSKALAAYQQVMGMQF